jgi:hypothetical protein
MKQLKMKINNIILKEGYKPIGIIFSIAFFLIIFISNYLGLIIFLIGFFMMYIYRNTNRYIFTNTQSVLAPIDSTVIAIDKVKGKFKIYCKVSLLNDHVLRAPIDADMKVKKYKHGLNLNPNSYKASLYNEQVTLKFEDIKVKLISGLYNTKIKRINDKPILQGEKFSVFLDGLVIISIQANHQLLINIEDKLISGQTILFKK